MPEAVVDVAEAVPWLTAPATIPRGNSDDLFLGPEDLAAARRALEAELGDQVAASIDLEALAIEAIAHDTPGGPRFRDTNREERIRILADAAVTRHRLAADVAYWEQQAARPLGSEKVSAEPPEPSGTKQPLAFRSPAEILAELPESIEWCWRSYLAFGTVTELVGKAKAAGKTTLLAHLTRAVVDGAPFLGHTTSRTPVVILTEQPPASLRAVLERADLADRDDLRILLWRDTRGVRWRDVVTAALAECSAVNARLLVVDTLPAFAGIRGEAENDAGAALEALEPLQVAAATSGLAIVVVRHERKAAGVVGETGRGSSAFTGAVDVVLRLARQENPVRPTIRVLEALSRFDETAEELVIELTDAGYLSLGSEAAVAYAEIRTALLELLPEGDAAGLAMAELEALIDGKRTTIQAALRELVDAGLAVRSGAGKRGDPYRYRRELLEPGQTTPGIHSAGGPPLQGETHTGQKRRSRPGRDASRSVGAEMAAILQEPEDVDEPEDMGPVLADLFPDFTANEMSA
jgi:AAA domain-containing protein